MKNFDEYYKLLISMATDQLIGNGITETVFIKNLQMIAKKMDRIKNEKA